MSARSSSAFTITVTGGLLLVWGNARHRSPRVTGIELSLYGCSIFMAELGLFFHTSVVWYYRGGRGALRST